MITPLRSAAIAAAIAAALGCVSAAPHAVDRALTLTSWSLAPGSVTQPSDRGSDPDDGQPCTFIADPGYLHGEGGNSQVIQEDGHAYMGCGGGPTISLDDTDGDTVTFSLHGDRIRVPEGASERLGPYWVHVVDVRGERVELELNDPD